MDPMGILTAVSASLGIIDQVADQLERFRNKEPEPPAEEPHSVLAERRGDTIHFVQGEVSFEQVTAEELSTKLDPDSQELLKALEESMNARFKLWKKVLPQREASPDPLVNAKVDTQLENLATGMCGDLGHILSFLEGMGKDLIDHYSHVRYVCSELSSGPR